MGEAMACPDPLCIICQPLPPGSTVKEQDEPLTWKQEQAQAAPIAPAAAAPPTPTGKQLFKVGEQGRCYYCYYVCDTRVGVEGQLSKDTFWCCKYCYDDNYPVTNG